MLTLLMLQEGDIYGYQLIQMLAERSGGKAISLSGAEGAPLPGTAGKAAAAPAGRGY